VTVTYYFSKAFDAGFDEAIERTAEALEGLRHHHRR